jgi:hypothetical protein
MSEHERNLMREHALYTRVHFEAGTVLCYGPVMARTGAYGFALFEVESEVEVRRILDDDPTVKSGLSKYDISPMRLGGARPSATGPSS